MRPCAASHVRHWPISSAKPSLKASQFVGRNRTTKVIPLGLVAFMSLEECQFIFGFHAFRDHPQVCKARPILMTAVTMVVSIRDRSDLANEGLVDLQGIDRELSKITEAGIAGTRNRR